MDITQFIVEFIKQGNVVELPGMGTLTSSNVAARHDEASGAFYPSRRTVVLSNAQQGNKAIVRAIAERDCVTNEIAEQMWKNYLDALNAKLSTHPDGHEFPGLGTLRNASGKTVFAAIEGLDLDADKKHEQPIQNVNTYTPKNTDDPFAAFEKPAVGVKPEVPETPVAPEIPETPGTPEIPEAPEVPEAQLAYVADEKAAKAAEKAAEKAAREAAKAEEKAREQEAKAEAERLAREEKEALKQQKAQEAEAKRREKERQMIENERQKAMEAAAKAERKRQKAETKKKDDGQKKKGKGLLIVLLILVVLALGGGAYYYFTHHYVPNTPAATNGERIELPYYSLFSRSINMLEYEESDIARQGALLHDYMSEYMRAFLSARHYSNCFAIFMNGIDKYADGRLHQLMNDDHYAVQRFMPFDDPYRQMCYDNLVEYGGYCHRCRVQGELFDVDFLEDYLDSLIAQYGLHPDGFDRAPVAKTATTTKKPAAPYVAPVVQAPTLKSSKQGFDIIAGFSTNRNSANAMCNQLKTLGCDAYVINRNSMYYVSMGSAATYTAAVELEKHIKSWYQGDTKIKNWNE